MQKVKLDIKSLSAILKFRSSLVELVMICKYVTVRLFQLFFF